MNTNVGSTLAQTNELHGLVTCLRIQIDNDINNDIRICNWTENLWLQEEDNTQREYLRYPFESPEISQETNKEIPSITVTLPISPLIYSIVKTNIGDILGNKVYIYYTNKELLDISPDKYVKYSYVLQNVSMNDRVIFLMLSVAYNIFGLKLPRRRFARSYCQWNYKDGINCPYDPDSFTTPTAKYFDVYDNPTSDPALDQCSKTLRGCVKRANVTFTSDLPEHKKWHRIPFGGFPGIPDRDPRKI